MISFPAMHLTLEWGEPGSERHGHAMPAMLVHGVVSRVFRIRIEGRGGVVGARFRADGFHRWTGLDAAQFTDRVVPAAGLLGTEIGAEASRLSPAADPLGQLGRLRQDLERRRPSVEPGELSAVVDRMARDPDLIRVDQVARAVGWSERTLQRRFRREVGIGPKWVLSRFRLQEAALALERDPTVDLATLATQLGFYDQAHLTNTFMEMLGETPARYAACATADWAGGQPADGRT